MMPSNNKPTPALEWTESLATLLSTLLLGVLNMHPHQHSEGEFADDHEKILRQGWLDRLAAFGRAFIFCSRCFLSNLDIDQKPSQAFRRFH